jgi:hypothetical protein
MVAAKKEATEPGVPISKVKAIASNVLRSPSWLYQSLRSVYVTFDPIVVFTTQSFFFIHDLLPYMTYHRFVAWLE